MKRLSHTNSQSFLFAIFKEFKKIGTCSCQVIDTQEYDKTTQTIFPNSWFYSPKRDVMKPYLKINGLESFKQQRHGNGRLCLQALFELAQRYGCEGRMLAEARFGSAGFYEACGFHGEYSGQDGLKYFNPTQKNLSMLYKGNTEKTAFKFIPLPTIDSEKEKNSHTDLALFNQMLQKANLR